MQESLRSNLGEYAPKVSERLCKDASYLFGKSVHMQHACGHPSRHRGPIAGPSCHIWCSMACGLSREPPANIWGWSFFDPVVFPTCLGLIARATGQHLGMVFFRSSNLPHVSWLALSREPPANIWEWSFSDPVVFPTCLGGIHVYRLLNLAGFEAGLRWSLIVVQVQATTRKRCAKGIQALRASLSRARYL
jgi:hypothetical protein